MNNIKAILRKFFAESDYSADEKAHAARVRAGVMDNLVGGQVDEAKAFHAHLKKAHEIISAHTPTDATYLALHKKILGNIGVAMKSASAAIDIGTEVRQDYRADSLGPGHLTDQIPQPKSSNPPPNRPKVTMVPKRLQVWRNR